MRALARRTNGQFEHDIEIRGHRLSADEPEDQGGDDQGPNPQELLAASLASCTAITMEMYAKRKGWDIGPIEVEADYTPAERGAPTRFNMVIRLPEDLTDEQVEKLRVIAAKCPVHRTLDGEVMFDEKLERVARAGAGS
jgi:putative redox protein